MMNVCTCDVGLDCHSSMMIMSIDRYEIHHQQCLSIDDKLVDIWPSLSMTEI